MIHNLITDIKSFIVHDIKFKNPCVKSFIVQAPGVSFKAAFSSVRLSVAVYHQKPQQ
jgi:hypothetical protein